MTEKKRQKELTYEEVARYSDEWTDQLVVRSAGKDNLRLVHTVEPDTSLTFTKRSVGGVESLEVQFRSRNKQYKTERCSLGHEHIVSEEKTPMEYEVLSIPWPAVSQLIGWLETGSWSEVRGKKRP